MHWRYWDNSESQCGSVSKDERANDSIHRRLVAVPEKVVAYDHEYCSVLEAPRCRKKIM